MEGRNHMLKTSAVLLIFLFTSKAVCSSKLAGDCRASFVDASLLNTQVIAVRNERYLLGISLGERFWRWGRWDGDTASYLEPSNRGIDCQYVSSERIQLSDISTSLSLLKRRYNSLRAERT
ncbi:hypothetical protein CMEL01_04037 [Colletotrichum melonis]|uniref:Uncharacterized protein n=1 Tax=Colletotrichum melonis TaxID=1209925 RepID=A0AAI9UBF9_9PEZI|nr:hypothetical protein CMEL01_04037 [Colletotrichum melonis]